MDEGNFKGRIEVSLRGLLCVLKGQISGQLGLDTSLKVLIRDLKEAD